MKQPTLKLVVKCGLSHLLRRHIARLKDLCPFRQELGDLHLLAGEPPAGAVGEFQMLVSLCPLFSQLFLQKELTVFYLGFVFGVPEKKIVDHVQQRTALAAGFHETDDAHKILSAEHLVQQAAHQVQVLVIDLDEDRAAFVKEFPRQKQAVAKVGKVGVDAELLGVPVGLDLLLLVGEVFVFVLDVPPVDAGLEVAGVLDAVGRVDVDHLHLAGHALFDE